jgi:uncharacterized protein (TIGR00106 family)
VVISLSVVPIGVGIELREHVAEVLRVIDASGLPYRLNAMSTEIEGDWDEVMAVVKAAHEAGYRPGGRVLTTIVIDDRRGAASRLEGKIADVEEILGKPLHRTGKS